MIYDIVNTPLQSTFYLFGRSARSTQINLGSSLCYRVGNLNLKCTIGNEGQVCFAGLIVLLDNIHLFEPSQACVQLCSSRS